jgi:hypothetical protein
VIQLRDIAVGDEIVNEIKNGGKKWKRVMRFFYKSKKED